MARRSVENTRSIQLAWRLHALGKRSSQIADELGYAPRTIDNWLSVKWLSERRLVHLAEGYVDDYDYCKSEQHDWLKTPEKFPWAVLVEDQTTILKSGAAQSSCIHTCRICGDATFSCGLPFSHPIPVSTAHLETVFD
jgi:hypothetical protein